MTLNTAISTGAGHVQGQVREQSQRLRKPLELARSIARFAAGGVEEGLTERDRRSRTIYEASGVFRGDSPSSDATVLDLVDRHRAAY